LIGKEKAEEKKVKIDFFTWIFKKHNILQHILNLVGLTIIIYGAWFNLLKQILLGFILILIGSWWEYVNKK